MPRPDDPVHFKRTHPGAVGARLDITVPDQDEDAHQVDVVRWLSQLQADVSQTLGGMLLRGTRPVQIGSSTGAMTQMAGSGGRLTGWSIREVSGATYAVVRFYDGRDTSGALIATVALSAGGSSNVSLPGNGASFINGLYCDLSQTPGNGILEGAAHLGAAD